MRGRLAIAALIMAMVPSSPLLAEHAHASKMQYSNNGAYVAALRVEYKVTDKGESVRCRLSPQKEAGAATGASATIDLSIANWTVVRGQKSACLDPEKRIPEGTEVWGRVLIVGGPNVSCRKSKAVLYSPSGGTIKYRSGGTTLNSNRCKVSSWP